MVCDFRYSRPDNAALIVLLTQAERGAAVHRRESGHAAGLTFTAVRDVFGVIGLGTNTEGQRSELGSVHTGGASAAGGREEGAAEV